MFIRLPSFALVQTWHFSSDKRECPVFIIVACICIWKKSLKNHFPKSTQLLFPGGKSRSSENCHCLRAGWSNHFPTLCLQEMWLFEAKPWGFEVPNHVRSIGLSDIVMMFFLRECPFCLSFSSMSLWQISPRHRRWFPYGGRLMCLLWFCLGLCWPCSSLRLLESAAHHSSPSSLQHQLCSLFRHAKKKKTP